MAVPQVYCSQCGTLLSSEHRFCYRCGTKAIVPQHVASPSASALPRAKKRVHRRVLPPQHGLTPGPVHPVAPPSPPIAPQRKKSRWPSILAGIALFVGAIVVSALLFPPSPATPPASSPSAASASADAEQSVPTPLPANSFSDGTYAVGADIRPGLYHTDGGSGCYWARLRALNTSGIDSIITNDNVSGPATVQIKPTDAGFQTQDCGTWSPIIGATAANMLATSFSDGIYVVHRDIKPGTYRTLGGEGCYWARMKDAGGANILANDNTSGPVVVTVSRYDGAIESKNCGTWTRVPDVQFGGTDGATSFGDGVWRVGVDIAPGQYSVRSQDGCYYEELNDFAYRTDSIVDNGNPTGDVDLQVDSNETVGFKSQGCGTWTIDKGQG